eukprot:5352249-Prymnesium_polylepis.2
MDHVLSPGAWHRAGVDYRDAAFLLSPRMRRAVSSAVDITLAPRARATGQAALPPNTLPLGTTTSEAVRLLGASDAQILRLPHARGLLCELGPSGEVATFRRLADRVLRAPPWCARCDGGCDKLLSRWFEPGEVSNRGPMWGRSEWCMETPRPPAFRQG